MTDTVKLTQPQRLLLARVQQHGMRRRWIGNTVHHWVPDGGSAVRRATREHLFDLRLIRVTKFALPDEIGITEAGQAYLEAHPA
jgi:hypothetical protein